MNSASYIRVLILISLFLLNIYMFTYSGRIETGDTRLLFNAVGSLEEYRDKRLDKTAWVNLPDPTIPNQQFPLVELEAEPLQLLTSLLLYAIAKRIPDLGMVHAVWLFNVFVGIGICCAIFFYATQLGYRQKVAILVALSLGVGTIVWPYTKSFFREPLAGLMILLTALSIERLRIAHYRSFKWLLGSVLAFTGAFLTKESIIFALPALLIIFVPSISYRWSIRLLQGWLALILGLVGVFIVISCFPSLIDHHNLYANLSSLIPISVHRIEMIHTALHSYLLNIGGSVWGTSPILILTLPGLWVFYERKKYRYIFALISGVMSFSVGYAVLRGEHWFGGLSWPPRFLLPVVPFLMLGTLPVFDLLMSRKKRSLLMVVGVLVLLAYSIWIQISGISLPWSAYPDALPPEANQLIEWSDGLNLVQYLRWVIVPQLWPGSELDFAWVRTGIGIWSITCAALAGITGVMLWRALKEEGHFRWNNRRKTIYSSLILISLVSIWFFMRAISTDSLYQGDNQSLRNLVPVIEANSQDNDILLLADNEYEPFFLNHYELHFPRVITLPDPPGEKPSPEQEPLVSATNPDALLVKHSIPLIHNLAETRSRLWLLASSGPWTPWTVRPVERFMISHYYPVRELSTDPPDPRVRLIEYATVDAPDPYAFRMPEMETDLRFGESIYLTGVDLPKGLSYHPGDALALSLYWSTNAKIERDYTVAWFVADSNGVVIQGFDTQPAWGFEPTSSWEPGVPVWDNHALWIPQDMKPGQYQIWVKLYQSDNSENLLPVEGSQVIDETIGVLPLTIEITSP